MAGFLISSILFLSFAGILIVSGAKLITEGQAGVFSPAKVDDVEVLKMADFATSVISTSSNSGPLVLVKIVKAEREGTNYKLLLELDYPDAAPNAVPLPCEVLVSHQPETNSQKLVRLSCTPKRKTRQVTRDGGYKTIDVNDATVKEMALFAATAISDQSNSGPVTLVKIVKAETQTVAGTNFKMKLELNGVEGTIQCDVIVFYQRWSNTRKLSGSDCFPRIDPY
jgi:hypothetical protein